MRTMSLSCMLPFHFQKCTCILIFHIPFFFYCYIKAQVCETVNQHCDHDSNDSTTSWPVKSKAFNFRQRTCLPHKGDLWQLPISQQSIFCRMPLPFCICYISLCSQLSTPLIYQGSHISVCSSVWPKVMSASV